MNPLEGPFGNSDAVAGTCHAARLPNAATRGLPTGMHRAEAGLGQPRGGYDRQAATGVHAADTLTGIPAAQSASWMTKGLAGWACLEDLASEDLGRRGSVEPRIRWRYAAPWSLCGGSASR